MSAASRKTQGTNSFLLAGIVLAILVAINLVARNRFVRIDMTENDQYTLSESTKKILGGLDDVVNVKVYFSRDLPTYLVTLTQQVRDMLDEYQAYGEKNLLVEWEDPADDPETEQRCRVLGIHQVQLQIFEKDKAQVANAYLGIAILYEDRHEVIPIVQGAENLEYDLTAAILKVFRKEEKAVGVLVDPSGAGPTLEKGLSRAKELLEKQYEVLPVDLTGGEPVPERVQTLLIAQPEDLSERTVFEIDQLVMRGGKLLLFHDPLTIPEGSIRAFPRRSGLRSLLGHYGLDVGDNVVLDLRSNANASFNQGIVMFSMPYPYWVKILPENVNHENPAVSKLSGIVLPWTSTVAAGTVPDSVTVDTLLLSSRFAWTKTGSYDLNPQQRFLDAPREPVERLPLAAVASGIFPSFFAGKEIPPVGGDAGEGTDEKPVEPARTILEKSPPTEVVVVGSGNLLSDDMIGQFPGNTVLLQNTVDWLTFGEDLIAIRSRAAVDRPLREVSERWKGIARFLATFGVPLLVVLAGLMRWLRVRGRRAALLAASESA